MSETAAIQRFAYTLAADEAFTVNMPGTFVYVEEAGGAFAIEKNSTGGQLQIPSGTKVRFTEMFTGLRIINKTAASNTVVLFIGSGDVEIAGATTIVGTVDVKKEVPPNYSDFSTLSVSTTPFYIMAADPTRAWVYLRASPSNTDTIWIIAASGGAGRGIGLRPGESYTLETTGDLYAEASSGTQSIERAVASY